MKPGETGMIAIREIDGDAVVTRDMRDADRSRDAVADYADAYARGDAVPPVEVFLVRGRFVLVDGLHRLMAHEARGQTMALATVVGAGSLDDAKRWALTQPNRRHGMRLSADDARHIVRMALESGLWDGASYSLLARELRIHRTTVSRYAQEWEAEQAKPNRQPTPVGTDSSDQLAETQSSREVDPTDSHAPTSMDDHPLPFEVPDPEPQRDAIDLLIEETDERAAELERAIRTAQRLARKMAGDTASPLASTANALAGELRALAGQPGQARIERHADCGGEGCPRCHRRGWVLSASVRRAERAARADRAAG